jgi:invasion protein IalB
MPGGCPVPVNFDAATMVALRSSTALKINATPTAAAAPFSVSLQGFATSLDCVAAAIALTLSPVAGYPATPPKTFASS